MRDLEKAAQHVIQNIGFDKLKKWDSDKQNNLKRNPFLNDLYESEQFLAGELLAISKSRKLRGSRLPCGVRSDAHYKTAIFCHVAHHLLLNLAKGEPRQRFQGMLAHAMSTPSGQMSLVHEFGAIAHLAQEGWLLNPFDIEQDAQKKKVDFLASKNGREIEVECKYVSQDKGRKIHRKAFCELLGAIAASIGTEIGAESGTTLIDIVLPNRLSHKDHDNIINSIQKRLERTNSNDGPVRISHHPTILSAADNLTAQNLRQHLTTLGYSPEDVRWAHAGLLGRGLQNNIYVVRSDKPDNYIDEIFEHLRAETREKYSVGKPGYLLVYLAGLSQDQLFEAVAAQGSTRAEATPLQMVANRLFKLRPFLHTICFEVEGRISPGHSNAQRYYSQNSSPYIFRNSDHPQVADQILNIFRA